MSFERISSLQNPKIKNLVKLRDAHHRKRQSKFLIEGRRELQRAIHSKFPIESIFFSESFFRTEEDYEFLDSLADQNSEIFALSDDAFKKAAYRNNPDGWLASATSHSQDLSFFHNHPSDFLIVVDHIEKPGNLGAIIRTANAAGVDALIVCDPALDLFNPNCIRASQGAFFDLPIILTHEDELRKFLNDQLITPILTTPSADKILWEIPLTGKIAIVMGAEDNGLSDSWLNSPYPKAKLPMHGVTDSLNVSVATGIALFEALRQRSV